MNRISERAVGSGTGLVVGPTARGELLSVVNAAGLVLDGIAFCPAAARLVVVHVHGSLGNFYQQPFLRVFANHLMRHGIALLAFNLTAHDGISEGYAPNRDMRYVGGGLSRFDTCLDDLDALLRVARSICAQVVLQGHSLGCDRVLFYAQRRSAQIPLILLSPCDSHRLQELWLDGEQIAEQVARLSSAVESSEPVVLLPAAEYGVNGPDGWTYSIPISRAALLSIITGPPFEILRLDDRSPGVVSNAPAFVYMGTEDAIRGATLDAMITHVRKLVPSAQVLKIRGDHSLDGCEGTVAERIVTWAYSVGLL